MNEFELISQFFKTLTTHAGGVDCGIGDDAALLTVPQGYQLAVSTDTLVSGVHFLETWPAEVIAQKALAVNLSDMAAMGAEPRWVSLALTLPSIHLPWLKSFARGLGQMADQYDVALVGGDTTRGPLSLSITIHGIVEQGAALLRSKEAIGDHIFITGPLGGAALAVKYIESPFDILSQDEQTLLRVLQLPKPRLKHGRRLTGIANAAVDISDGFLADLSHVLEASRVGATIEVDKVLQHSLLANYLSPSEARDMALNGGDDYELCFTVGEDKLALLRQRLDEAGLPYYPVGRIEERPGLRCIDSKGHAIVSNRLGYQHF